MTSIFDKLEAEEKLIFTQRFLSPVVYGSKVKIRANGVNVFFSVRPKGFHGWGIFQPVSANEAALIEYPTLEQKQEYLSLFPECVLMVTDQEKSLASLLIDDGRFKITGSVPVLFPENLQLFDAIKVRFDGVNMWYDSHFNHFSTLMIDRLRDSINVNIKPENLEKHSGLTKAILGCYNIVYQRQQELLKSSKEYQVKNAVERAGGKFAAYKEIGNRYSVEYFIDGQRHTSLVNKDTLRVESAGICLNGTDSNFDLQSLISVVREGHNTHRIVRVGHNR